MKFNQEPNLRSSATTTETAPNLRGDPPTPAFGPKLCLPALLIPTGHPGPGKGGRALRILGLGSPAPTPVLPGPTHDAQRWAIPDSSGRHLGAPAQPPATAHPGGLAGARAVHGSMRPRCRSTAFRNKKSRRKGVPRVAAWPAPQLCCPCRAPAASHTQVRGGGLGTRGLTGSSLGPCRVRS